jgi:hypothetical protein
MDTPIASTTPGNFEAIKHFHPAEDPPAIPAADTAPLAIPAAYLSSAAFLAQRQSRRPFRMEGWTSIMSLPCSHQDQFLLLGKSMVPHLAYMSCMGPVDRTQGDMDKAISSASGSILNTAEHMLASDLGSHIDFGVRRCNTKTTVRAKHATARIRM